ncbi:hypothetical protein [Guptibacillus algicola]|uniref:hypothetical protein n=1 Tax=Guptibacillus algicola TaxID=225844 RepID=UPI001CD6DB17|nr:hypothetical protein [Alkalihalobacillus algicola]MCA0987838.1 hypothetical protein [Alkalihalobacillus algicola]
MNHSEPEVVCPSCQKRSELHNTITAQSNQNIIFACPYCGYEKRNIETSKG